MQSSYEKIYTFKHKIKIIAWIFPESEKILDLQHGKVSYEILVGTFNYNTNFRKTNVHVYVRLN